jgi:hypothetical protein
MSSTAADFYNKKSGLYDLQGELIDTFSIEGPNSKAGTSETFAVTVNYAGGSIRQEIVTMQAPYGGVAPLVYDVCTGCG